MNVHQRQRIRLRVGEGDGFGHLVTQGVGRQVAWRLGPCHGARRLLEVVGAGRCAWVRAQLFP